MKQVKLIPLYHDSFYLCRIMFVSFSAKTLIHIMSQYGWRRLALIYETNELGTHIKEWVVDEVSKATDLRILRKQRMNNHMTDGYLQRLLNSIKTHATGKFIFKISEFLLLIKSY